MRERSSQKAPAPKGAGVPPVAAPTDRAMPADIAAQAAARMLGQLGARVREARARKGLPRRAVAEASGVSMRYLAQIEAGAGNVSIGRLQRVARALDMPLEVLVGRADPWGPAEAGWAGAAGAGSGHDPEAQRIAAAWRAAPPEAQARARAALGLAPAADPRAGRICLVGLRGAGKSTLGAMAGAALGLPFVELNREIAEHAGMPVTELMALYGPDGYRRLEAEAVDRAIAVRRPAILAVAGGIVAGAETYDKVLAHFHTVWIKATPEEHMARVRAQGDLRPMAGNRAAMDQLRDILERRAPAYSRAHATLDTSGTQLEAAAEALVALIRERGFLAPA